MTSCSTYSKIINLVSIKLCLACLIIKIVQTQSLGLQQKRTGRLNEIPQQIVANTGGLNSQNGASITDISSSLDPWDLEIKEYDLFEFLGNLSSKYNNSLYSPDSSKELDTKSSASWPVPLTETQNKSSASEQSITSDNSQTPTTTTLAYDALSGGDSEIAESNWQYGIFDRFTRMRSTTTTKSPDITLSVDDIRGYNSDECGLRTYSPTKEDVLLSAGFFGDGSPYDLNSRFVPYPPVHRRQQHLPTKTIDRTEDTKGDPYDRLAVNNPIQQVLVQQSTDERDCAQHKNLDHLTTKLEKVGYEASQLREVKESHQQQSSPSSIDESQISPDGFIQDLLGRRSWLQNSTLPDKSGMVDKNKTAAISEQKHNNLDLKSSDNKWMDRLDALTLEARVIGGSDARLGDSPWSVSLQALVSRPGTGVVEYRHFCGGTIISDNYILTAAHCLDFMVGRESRLFVAVGDLHWRLSPSSRYGRRVGVERMVIHASYKSTAFGHDIGLIRTKEPIRPLKVAGRYIVNTVCLPEKGVEHDGDAELVGWGLFSNRNEMADALQIADVPILPRSLCVDLYRRRTGLIQWLIGIELITDKQVCAGTFGRGICQGDSGSALVYNERSNSNSRLQANSSRATIIGTVAFGGIRRCSYQSLPGVYMQTSKYIDWIVPRMIP